MRKFVLFALFFGGGLAVLWFASQYRKEKREEVAPLPVTRPDGLADQVPTEIPTGGDGPGVRVVSSGYGSFTRYDDDTGQVLRTLNYEDSKQLENNRYELLDVEVQTFDPQTGDRRAVMTAERAIGVIVAGEAAFRVDPETPVRFEDAVLVIEEEGSLAPLTVSMPWVDVWPDEERFESDAPVTVEGVGLSASSLGIRVQDLGRRLRLPARGDVRLKREDGGDASLRAVGDGVIDVERVEGEGTDILTVKATKGSHFEWTGDQPITVDAQDVEVRAEVRSGEQGQRHRIVSARASKDVVMSSTEQGELGPLGTRDFEADRATFRFDGQGELEGATLIGSPSGVLTSAPGSDDGLTRLEFNGEGPLAIGFEGTRGVDLGFEPEGLTPSLSFAMEGAGSLTLEGIAVTLTAARRMTGVFDREAQRARVMLSGAVVATGTDGLYEGSELDLSISQGEANDALVIGTTVEPAVIETHGDALDPWRIETEGELEFHLRSESFDVPLARDVHIESRGPAPISLDAGRLKDFSWVDRTFRADQDVRFETPRGTGRADRVEALTKTNRVFSGTQDRLAEFFFKSAEGENAGSLKARQVWVMPGVVTAEDEVALRMLGEGGTHELACDRALLRSPLIVEDTDPDAVGVFDIDAYGVRRAVLRTSEGEANIACEHLVVHGRVERTEDGDGQLIIDSYDAQGGMTAELRGKQDLTVTGRSFRWSEAKGGRIEPEEGKRLTAFGRLPRSELPYELTADEIRFTGKTLHAVRPLIDFETQLHVPEDEDLDTGRIRQVSANHLEADELGALFSGEVHMSGHTEAGADQPWELSAGFVHLTLENLFDGEQIAATNIRDIVAWDGIKIQVGPDQTAHAEMLFLNYRVMRLEGSPAVFDLRGFVWESSAIEFDVVDVLLTTEQGTIRTAPNTSMAGWTIRYESMRPFPREDDTILALRGAVATNGLEQVRANWMLFFVDRDEWRERAEGWLDIPIDASGIRVGEERPPPAEPKPVRDAMGGFNQAIKAEQDRATLDQETPNIFGALNAEGVSDILREVYLEGDIELQRRGEHASRFEAFYVDLVDGHGWVEDAELTVKLYSRGEAQRVSVKTDLLSHSADGSLHADAATVTTCMFAKPEYVIETGDLDLIPDKDPDASWRISVRKNSLRFQDKIKARLPLPSINNAAIDQRGRPVIPGVSFGSSSRYGNFVSLGFSKGAGDAVSEGIGGATGTDPKDVDANYSARVRWLSSRGLLLQGGFDVQAADKFTSEFYLSGINDDAEDVGMVRVPTDERSAPRWGLAWRSRYLLTKTEWVDFVLTKSSDAGFQSEFYEPEFSRFEDRESYLHWRKARDEQYYHAMVRFRTDSFRNEIEELPAIGAYNGLKPVGHVFGERVLYRGDADLAYLRRREGSGSEQSPFDPVSTDPFGERETARFLTEQRLEVPVDVGAGVVLTPFSTLAGGFWSEGVDESQSPARAALFLGAEAAGEYHKVLPGNYLNTIVPSIGFRSDFADYDEGGIPVPYDTAEQPLNGNFVDLAFRTRLTRPEDKRRFDVGLKTTYAYETTRAQDSGWDEMSVLSEFYTEYRDIPVAFTYDMRFDLDASNTTYSRSALGFEPWDPLALEFGYNRGLDPSFERLYEAASIAARWDINWKWNLEARQSISLKGDDSLYSEYTFRRYGHDVFLEVKFFQRQGEGSSVSFGIKPAFGYHLDDLGLLDSWKRHGLR